MYCRTALMTNYVRSRTGRLSGGISRRLQPLGRAAGSFWPLTLPVLRVEVGDIDLAIVLGRGVDRGFPFVRCAGVEAALLDSHELPCVVPARVIERIGDAPTPAAAAIMGHGEGFRSRLHPLKWITQHASAGGAIDDPVIALHRLESPARLAHQDQQRPLAV